MTGAAVCAGALVIAPATAPAAAGQATAAAGAGPAAKRAVGLTLGLRGGSRARAEICGSTRRVTLAGVGDRVTARVSRRARRGRRARPAARRRAKTSPRLVSIQTCEGGRWEGATQVRVLRGRATITTANPGEFRLLARQGRVRSRVAYLRVDAVRSVDASFRVVNANRSAVSCASDGAEYTVRGRIVSPARGAPGSFGPAITVNLHGLSFGRFFWDFGAVPGYDHASALAARGHTSLVIDRLGYDASDHPPGGDICLGSQADMAHQIVTQLRAGGYTTATGTPPQFDRVAIAGHSFGGNIVEVESYSFGGIDALIVMSWADSTPSSDALAELLSTGGVCTGGGEPAEEGQPSGYAYFGQGPGNFRKLMFHDAEPEVVEAATELRNRDPCGDTDSAALGPITSQQRLADVKVPVLLVYGENDAVWPPSTTADHPGLFTGTEDLTTITMEGTGHALTLERSAPELQARLAEWLAARGL